jgi:hypothetical protein
MYPDPPETGLLIWPNPSAGNFSLLPPEEVTGEVTITLTTSSGAIVKRFRQPPSQASRLNHDFTALPRTLHNNCQKGAHRAHGKGQSDNHTVDNRIASGDIFSGPGCG